MPFTTFVVAGWPARSTLFTGNQEINGCVHSGKKEARSNSL
jgi:hypothetical protein